MELLSVLIKKKEAPPGVREKVLIKEDFFKGDNIQENDFAPWKPRKFSKINHETSLITPYKEYTNTGWFI
jgi:hypothetical protein